MPTIKDIESAILAALEADATTGAYKGGVISADDAASRLSRGILSYPCIVVVYEGADAEVLAGGTGAGLEFSRAGRWQITVLDKSYRGDKTARHGDDHDAKHPGAYATVEEVLRVIGYRALGLGIKRFEFEGDEYFQATWDDTVVGYTMMFSTQWETTCVAD